jgi:uncharacterized protein YyaL (SSP411 family)
MSAPAPSSAPTRENRLAHETSPYLLQHAHNPVAWWPWGPEALAEAKRSGKPILLSVGYAACHWCHVMAHESFEDDATAAVMNELFVNIKVDREERPDIDQIYMTALHHLGEQGGWPLTMFLTPEGEPVWGGTYFPNTSRYGKPGFVDVLREIARLFREEPQRIAQNRQALMERLSARARPAGKVVIGEAELDDVASRILKLMDPVLGGLQGAPKFPQAAIFELLWRAGLREETNSRTHDRHPEAAAQRPSKDDGPAGASFEARPLRGLAPQDNAQQGASAAAPNRYFTAVAHTLERICAGGIYDHLGGGFSRYSVDERWLVPHFEKMLYDNAHLLELLALAWIRNENPLYHQRARETVGWLAREMTTPEGAFASSLDADSEGEEGKFYVWSLQEIRDVLGGEDAEFFAAYYDVTPQGNFEGRNILNQLDAPPASEADEARLAELRAKLLTARAERVRPGLDDKTLADWNGEMIAALTHAGRAFREPEWIAMAARAFGFVAGAMARGDRLGHSWRAGRLLFPGLASDFVWMIRAALALYEAGGEARYLTHAVAWQQALERHHAEGESGGYFLTAEDAAGLVIRPSASHDDAIANHNAVAAANLVRLAVLTGDDIFRTRADQLFDGLLPAAAANVFGHAGLLNALDLRLRAAEIVITGEAAAASPLLDAALRLPFLETIVLRGDAALPPTHPARDKIAAVDNTGAAFVCIGQRCSLPVTSADELARTVATLPAAP